MLALWLLIKVTRRASAPAGSIRNQAVGDTAQDDVVRESRLARWRAHITAWGAKAWANPGGAAFAFGALGILGYVWFRLASALFYMPLGVSPEDVGVRYPTVLAQAVYGVVVLTVIPLIPPLLALGAMWLAALPLPKADVMKRARWRGASVFIAISALVFVSGEVGPPAFEWVRAAYIWWLLLAGLGFSLREDVGFGRIVRGLLVLAFASGLVGPLVFAAVSGQAAREGRVVARAPLGVPLLPWNASAANVQWKTKPPFGMKAGECVLYLGDSTGGALIYTEGKK